MKLSKIATSLVLPIALSGCYILKVPVYENLEFKKDINYECGANKRTLEALLGEVWDSGFFAKNDTVNKEIRNNKYGIFSILEMVDVCYRCRGIFLHDRFGILKDKILLYEDLICSEEKGKLEKAKPILIHELFHDFFTNILTSEQKEGVISEAKKFYDKIIKVNSKEKRLNVLRSFGLSEPKESDYHAYRHICDRGTMYGLLDRAEDFFNDEIYALIAESAFSNEIVIPKPLRIFYKNIISEKILNRNTIR